MKALTNSTRMKLDLLGRVGNISSGESRPLQPLFEAIVNSIRAIHEANVITGRITIRVARDEAQGTFSIDDYDTRDIQDFVVSDNGIGFTNVNYASFEKSDSRIKTGAKGIGRFLWLKAFDEVHIKSVFRQDAKWFERGFDFLLTDEGVENHFCNESQQAESATTVRLCGFKKNYRESCPKALHTIAMRTVEHCLAYFLDATCPMISLSDGQNTIELNKLFKDDFQAKNVPVQFEVKDTPFEITNLRRYSGDDRKHRLHFCANNRSVLEIDIAKHVPDAVGRLKDTDGRSFKYVGFVSGEYLNKWVNDDRSRFDIPVERSSSVLPGGLLWREIENAAINEVSGHLEPFIHDVAEAKMKRTEQYITKKAPQYMGLLRYKRDALNRLPPNLNEEKLDDALHRIHTEVRIELKEQSRQILTWVNDGATDIKTFMDNCNHVVEQLSAFSKYELTHHIVQRKLILDLLDGYLKKSPTSSKYPLEERIHGLIFPMRTTSFDVDYNEQNLWIVDERLMYHKYLASDKTLHSIEETSSISTREPDIAIFFDVPIVLGEGDKTKATMSSVVIIEFKRPMRTSYKETENPITEVLTLASEIKAGRRTTDDGSRPINIEQNAPFYCYVICDITEKIKQFAERQGCMRTPDGAGYFFFNTNYPAYVEIISYDKLKADARKRNRILFEKLNIPYT
jgi:hypothetical protein